MKELRNQTKLLKQCLNKLRDRYENNTPPEHIRDKTFFLMMKEQTAEIYSLLENWTENALHIIKNEKINVHPHQIVSTQENVELLILHSYYIDARRRRYMELYNSSHYIFDQLLRGLVNNPNEQS